MEIATKEMYDYVVHEKGDYSWTYAKRLRATSTVDALRQYGVTGELVVFPVSCERFFTVEEAEAATEEGDE